MPLMNLKFKKVLWALEKFVLMFYEFTVFENNGSGCGAVEMLCFMETGVSGSNKRLRPTIPY